MPTFHHAKAFMSIGRGLGVSWIESVELSKLQQSEQNKWQRLTHLLCQMAEILYILTVKMSEKWDEHTPTTVFI